MRGPSPRVGRNRRRVCLYLPFLGIGALAVLTSSPVFNGADLFGVFALSVGAAGFVHETGKDHD
ncbi:hypothetical protein HOU96_gp38 [Arthrobacter phage Maja]|uniref:Uncharacterized protein n=1 Tax=Arthrobacter phage Maja TaxID=2499009 RepID=A0A3S9UNG9_9CAUD|nr:hypothetical protein HOU96_gp38 [Arthrobacter phage Maja]AZS11736.1 hypothetical protein PBI_MAJA_38 [Arthrobacter phage Maja]